MKLKDKLKRQIWLVLVFIVRIVFSKRKYKVPILKSLYYNLYGFTANQVALYDLNKQNKNEYLSEFDWYKSRKINYPNSYKLNNKLICNKIIKDYVNIPKTYIIRENGFFKDINNKIISNDDVIKILKQEKSFFLKPISIGKGRGIRRIDYKDNKFMINFKEVSLKELMSELCSKDNYFISERIKQNKYLDNIYNKTSNTIRLITIRDNDNVSILAAVQRIGTKETIPVDNGSQGGLVANIDIDKGILSEARSLNNKNIYEKHPDSKNDIKGVIIPNWDKIKEEVMSVAYKLTDFKFIAWDILPTSSSFSVIEANNSSGVNIIQVFGGQRNKKLGNYYRKQGIIK